MSKSNWNDFEEKIIPMKLLTFKHNVKWQQSI